MPCAWLAAVPPVFAYLLGEVVKEHSVLLSKPHTELKVLESTERSQQLRTELVRPLAQKVQLSRRGPVLPVGRRIVQLGRKGRRRGPRGGVPGSMSVEDVDLGNLAGVGDSWRRVGQTISGRLDRIPWGEVSPVLGNVHRPARGLGLVRDEGERGRGVGVVRERGGGLDRSGLDSGRCGSGVSHCCFAGELVRVDRG